MAPESARRYGRLTNELIGPTSDVWSFLILLFEITHGHWPNEKPTTGGLNEDEVFAEICGSEDYAADIKSLFLVKNVPNLKKMFFTYLHSDPFSRVPIQSMLNDCVFLHSLRCPFSMSQFNTCLTYHNPTRMLA